MDMCLIAYQWQNWMRRVRTRCDEVKAVRREQRRRWYNTTRYERRSSRQRSAKWERKSKEATDGKKVQGVSHRWRTAVMERPTDRWGSEGARDVDERRRSDCCHCLLGKRSFNYLLLPEQSRAGQGRIRSTEAQKHEPLLNDVGGLSDRMLILSALVWCGGAGSRLLQLPPIQWQVP